MPRVKSSKDDSTSILTDFSASYKETIFLLWYESGRPSISKLQKLIPPDEEARTPKFHTLQTWYTSSSWAIRADEMDAEIARKIEQTAIAEKIEMIKRHAKAAMLLITKGEEFLETTGITKSADAVRAIIQGMEAEKVSRGVQISLGEIEGLSNDGLVAFVEKKLALAATSGNADEIIEGEVVDAEPE